jgi:hypothetical protein
MWVVLLDSKPSVLGRTTGPIPNNMENYRLRSFEPNTH